MSILLVEHDMDFVMGLTDRIVVMEFGTQLIEGTPAEVQASPAVRAAYLGTEHWMVATQSSLRMRRPVGASAALGGRVART